MKALLLVDKRKLELTDMPTPSIGSDDLLVRVKACGICGSDVHGYDLSTGRRIPPIVMGHEAAGTVEAIGSNVRNFSAGDRITFDSMISCGTCHFCRTGAINLCDNRRVLGVSCGDYRRHGCFAEYVSIPQHIAYKLPGDLSFEHAATVEAVSIAVHAAARAPALLGRSVVVVGAGMIGQLTLQTARAAGCGTLIILDLDDTRLQRTKAFGADHALRADAPDIVPQIIALTNGRGADVVFEAVGSNAPIQTAIASARKGGSVVLIGNTSPNVQLPLQSIVTREITLLGTCGSSGEYPACLDLMARGKINVKSLITAQASLDQGPSWFERLYAHEPGLMKVILNP
ncbi:MAG TPA: galactitol-1-phosphate 5-dehydrogenase [Phycisphaerae bacterium]